MPAFTTPSVFHDLVQLLVQGMDSLDFFEEASRGGVGVVFRGYAETFGWLLQVSNSTYQQQSLEECVLFALKICSARYQPDMAGLVRTILKGKEMDENICGVRDEFHRTLLHNAARNLGEVLTGAFSDQTAKLEDILHLIGDLVKGG